MKWPFVWRKDYEKLEAEIDSVREAMATVVACNNSLENQQKNHKALMENLEKTTVRVMDEAELYRTRLVDLAALVSDFHPTTPIPVHTRPSLGNKISEALEKEGLLGTKWK